jgi:hypothetical protein
MIRVLKSLKILRQTLGILLLIFLVSSCGKKTESSIIELNAKTTTSNGYKIIGKWNTFPQTLSISTDFDQYEVDEFNLMADQWIDATDKSLEFFNLPNQQVNNRSTQTLEDFKQDEEMGIYKRESWFESVSSNSIAITQYVITLSANNEIATLKHADIMINYEHYKFAFFDDNGQIVYEGSSGTNNDKKGPYDLSSVILHELGHFVGLDHLTETAAVMYKGLSKYQVKKELTPLDKLALFDLYELDQVQTINIPTMMSLSNNSPESVNTEKVTMEKTGIIELREDGNCLHYLDQKLIHQHRINLKF